MRDEETQQLANMLRESLENGRQPLLTITSNSMSPLLKKGDQIKLSNVSFSQLVPGDIVTVEYNHHLLTHRYWYERQTNIITRGDQPLSFDPPTPKNDLIGQITIRKRNHKILYLDKGFGRWLNKHLAWLANLENRWIIKSTEANPSDSWWQLRFHRFLNSWRLISTYFVEKISSKSQSD